MKEVIVQESSHKKLLPIIKEVDLNRIKKNTSVLNKTGELV
jgi:hypothetical protein